MISTLRNYLNLIQARLSRQITAWVFLSILVIEIIIFIPSYYRREQELFANLEMISGEMVALLVPQRITPETLARFRDPALQTGSVVLGGALYALDGTLIGTFGEVPALTFRDLGDRPLARYHSDDWKRYDVARSPELLNQPYVLVIRHDASWVSKELSGFKQRIAGLIILICLFVTAVLMWVLSLTVILPVVRLRQDLMSAGDSIGQAHIMPRFSSLSLRRQDEVTDVAKAFQAMFGRVQQEIRDRHQAEQALRSEQEKAERLLLNILPQPIAEKLKHDQQAIADRFEQVTILFADIVDFTTLSSRISPIELVGLLNRIFSTFDQLAERHGLEKIKTIGDAYMVVGGLPMPQDNHVEAIADMALDMQSAIAHFHTDLGEPFQLRIGISTGPVVSGVIGLKKFIYDLWGDAVNIASRMESQGEIGRIQVTEAVYQQLRDRYHLEKRGIIDVKGYGKMTTYWLIDRQASEQAA